MTPTRRNRPLATLALGLSLWMALPSLEWCPFDWDQCRAMCETADVEATSCSSEGCVPASGACDRSPDPVPLGDRAWCVHPPVDGVVVHPIELSPPDAAPLLAVLAALPELQPPVTEARNAATRTFLPPVLVSPHAPPLGRAPPSA